jgi:membrane protein YdbS with pleckstrin-like domain
MYQRLCALLLRGLKVPSEPYPPYGDPASLRVFRAGRNYLRLLLLRWGVTQAFALWGIVFWLFLSYGLDERVEQTRRQIAERRATAAVSGTADTPSPSAAPEPRGPTATAENTPRSQRERRRLSLRDVYRLVQRVPAGFLARFPPFVMWLVWLFELGGIVLYLVQLPTTFLLARLDFDMRWYMVTDRSLRIRYGIWRVMESTMSFANIQQVMVSQGPLQRLLGLADVRVHSAGGGGADKGEPRARADDMHMGLFHSVDNAAEVRDLILARLRRFRESGLGDPDEHTQPTGARAPSVPADREVLAAARELAEEALALRRALVADPATGTHV